MTLQEFADHWKITKGHAQAYLARCGNLQKEEKHYIYDPVRIKIAHDLRLISSLPKQDDEVDFQDIWATYKSKVGYNKLSRLTNSKEFPEVKRECCCGVTINKRVWHKSQIDAFFESFNDIKKIKHIVRRHKELSNDARARLTFLARKKVTALPVRFNHRAIWEVVYPDV